MLGIFPQLGWLLIIPNVPYCRLRDTVPHCQPTPGRVAYSQSYTGAQPDMDPTQIELGEMRFLTLICN
jgi:hypothetical protein